MSIQHDFLLLGAWKKGDRWLFGLTIFYLVWMCRNEIATVSIPFEPVLRRRSRQDPAKYSRGKKLGLLKKESNRLLLTN